MRGIFFALLFFNIIAFLWSMVLGSDDTQVRPTRSAANPYSHIPELVLLSEITPVDKQATVSRLYSSEIRNETVGIKTGENSGSTPSEGVREHDGRPLCELVGPFENRDGASEFVERLSGIEVSSVIKDMELPSGPGYWVYLQPSQDRKQALRRLAELQAKGIDSYVIPKGELANGISLGMFSQKNLAEARHKEMSDLGLEPKIQEIERSYREIWVMLEKGEGAKMSKYTWDKVLEGANMLERRQNYCLDVASQ